MQSFSGFRSKYILGKKSYFFLLFNTFYSWCYTPLLKTTSLDRNHIVLPLQEASIELPVGKARPAYPHVLQQAKVGHLVLAAGVIKQHRWLHFVGLYTSHIVWLLQNRTSCSAGMVWAFFGCISKSLFAFSIKCYITGDTATLHLDWYSECIFS